MLKSMCNVSVCLATVLCGVSWGQDAGRGASGGGDDCVPDPTGQSCEGGCGMNQSCVPSRYVVGLDGSVSIASCDCAGSCGIQYDADLRIFNCINECFDTNPPGPCELKSYALADGRVLYECGCHDDTDPQLCEVSTVCNPNQPGTCTEACSGPCPAPTPDDICLPKEITQLQPGNPDTFRITSCDCEASPDVCHPVVMGDIVECVADCPDGTPCPLAVENVGPAGELIWSCPPCDGMVDPTGACCVEGPQGGLMCIEPISSADCHAQFGTYFGDGSTCTPNPCDPMSPIGACCFPEPCADATCADLNQTDCVDMGGLYQGNFTSCAEVDICDEPEGACCIFEPGAGSFCQITTSQSCNEQFGVYQGDDTTCSDVECPQEVFDCGVGECCERPPRYTAPDYAGFTGEVVVVTKDAPALTDPRVVVVDTKNKPSAPLNTNWAAATRYSHPTWDGNTLGSIYGLSLDPFGHIYVTATTSYYSDLIGIGTAGAIYRLDNTTGAVTVLANLPNTGPGLGNIAYDCRHRQFFVTNMEDGKIYRVSLTGTILSTFDHGAPDSGSAGFAPRGDRPWGVQVYDNRVYYGIWWEDEGNVEPAQANEIWSVSLGGGTGADFLGTEQLEITMPPRTGSNRSSPVSDISFSTRGHMLLGERPMNGDTNPAAHTGRVLEYFWTGSSWAPTPNLFSIGVFTGENSTGGVDYDLSGNVWATGDALQFGPQTIYGAQCLPGTGGNVGNSVLVDLDGDLFLQEKTRMGDIESPCTPCVPPPPTMVAWWTLDEPSGPTAVDIAGGNDGTHTNGPLVVTGAVSRAVSFDGVDDRIVVPDNGSIDMAGSDWSIDAWVRTCSIAEVSPIVDKQGIQDPVGYEMFLFNGNLAFQMGDAGGAASFDSGAFVADGIWHHVTVTVDRDAPTGIRFYVDGAPILPTHDPTPSPGSASNALNLFIGAGHPAGSGGQFDGEIDEVEIFRRVLTPGEVQDLYRAGAAGKCKETCIVPWDRQFCNGQTQRNVDLVICNYSNESHDYSWSLGGVAAGPPGCLINGPTVFSPSGGTVTIPAGTCTTITVTIDRPAGLTPYLVGCYDFFVTNLDTGHKFNCRGSVQAVNKWCLIAVDPTPVTPVPIGGGGIAVVWEIADADGTGGTFDAEIVVMDPTGGDGGDLISLDGLPPGEPVVRTVKIPPTLGTPTIGVNVQMSAHEPFGIYDILLFYDDDGNGTRESVISAAIQSSTDVPPCSTIADCADTNGDSIRDDNCTWWACEAGACVGTGIPFGDMGGQFGLCPPDGTPDGNDRFHALNCFSDTDPNGNPGDPYTCEADSPVAYNVDAGGQFGSCAPDGVCDGNDAFLALNAFSGTTSCTCPLGGPQPSGGPITVGHTGLSLVPSASRIRPGGIVEVDVILKDALKDLRGYQLHLAARGGATGRLELVDIVVNQASPLVTGSVHRSGNRGAGDTNMWSAFNVATRQMVAGTDEAGRATAAQSYLATFIYRASPDASGRFVVDILHDADDSGHRTFLFPTLANGQILVRESTSATIEVERRHESRIHKP